MKLLLRRVRDDSNIIEESTRTLAAAAACITSDLMESDLLAFRRFAWKRTHQHAWKKPTTFLPDRVSGFSHGACCRAARLCALDERGLYAR